MKIWCYCELMVIAPTRNKAIDVLRDHLGCSRRAVSGGLLEFLCDTIPVVNDDGEEKIVSQEEFCRTVNTFGGTDESDRKANIGIVHEGR